jgi:hydroxymethylglutaryl-CoA lyase
MNRVCSGHLKLLNKINPVLFDVSLRDGIQSANPALYPLNHKKQLFDKILTTYTPTHMEVGSIVSPKVLQIMSDSLDVYAYAKSKTDKRMFLLVPNMAGLKTALNAGADGVSFITSVSDSFQLKNTKKTLIQTKIELNDMCYYTKTLLPNTYIKLYISCINQCPIDGKLNDDDIVREILCYSDNTHISELCLSDTCGTLSYKSLKYIVDKLIAYRVPINKLSLHLHVNPDEKENVVDILFYCFEKGINKFDVSCLDEGGCVVTLGSKVKPNLTYELFHSALHRYITWKNNEFSDV